jgi:hypothetical protein
MLASLYGWYECATTMPCVATQTATGHREIEDAVSIPVECACAPPQDGEQVGVRVSGAVTKLLDFNETRSNPKAIATVREEIEDLEKYGTWDSDHMCERQEVETWARDNKVTVHIGLGLGICSIKFSEMPASMQVHKGRFCFRTPTARDEGGALAIFQEMSSRPTTIASMNVSVAYGALMGHKTTVADAVKAYVQSDLKSVNMMFRFDSTLHITNNTPLLFCCCCVCLVAVLRFVVSCLPFRMCVFLMCCLRGV